MDNDTLILITLLVAALCWWMTIHINAERHRNRQYNKNALEKLERAERVRRLTNKL